MYRWSFSEKHLPTGCRSRRFTTAHRPCSCSWARCFSAVRYGVDAWRARVPLNGRPPPIPAILAVIWLCMSLRTPARAADEAAEIFAVHGQFTYVEQETSGFNAPYAGPNSLTPNTRAETVDFTPFLGARLWHGAEIWTDPEIDQGFGLDNALGVAGFPSGEDYKVGRNQPYLRLPRLFVRQSLDIDACREGVDPAQIQLGGTRSPNRWVFTVGKFSVTDIFDANQYAHDPKSDFFNWAAIDAGTL